MGFAKYNPKISVSNQLKRKENRFNYSMPLMIRTKSERYSGTSINISSNGMKLSIQGHIQLSVADFIYINMPELTEYLNSFLVEQGQKKKLEFFMYEVVYIVHEDNATIIACQYTGHSNNDLTKLESYIEEKLQICQIDYSHDINNIKNTYHDHLFFNDIVPLVYYFIPKEKNCLFIESERNRNIYNYLTSEQHPEADLSPFISAEQLTLMSKTVNSEEFLLFIFWQDDQLHYFYSFEIDNKQTLKDVLQHTIANNGFVLQAYIKNVSFTEYHKTPSSKGFNFPLSETQSLFQVVLYDITQFTKQCFFELFNFHKSSPSELKVPPRQTQENYNYDFFLFNSHSKRNEGRYIYQTGVVVYLSNSDNISAQTVDFSYSGIALTLDGQRSSLKINTAIHIDFIDLNKQMKNLELSKIPFIIKNISQCKFTNNTTLGLVRDSNNCNNEVNQFFRTIVEKNQVKLTACKQEKLNYIEKQLIQNKLKETLHSIPVFLSVKNNELQVKTVKLYNNNSSLARFFKTDGQFDFSCLTRPFLIERFSEYLHEQRDRSIPFLAFLIKVNDQIKLVTNEEIKQSQHLKMIFIDTHKKQGHCILIKLYESTQFDEQAFEISYKSHLLDQPDEMHRTREKVRSICGYLELMDISAFVRLFDHYELLYD